MAVISQETFEKFSKKERLDLIKRYEESSFFKNDNYYEGISDCLEVLFGKENLQSGIKTWKDVEDKFRDYQHEIDESIGHFRHATFMDNGDNPICKKIIATYKIAKLIELGYGGNITDEEWRDKNTDKWMIISNDDNGKLIILNAWYNSYRGNIAFHTKELAREFISYPENKTLIEQYYMI